MCLQPVVDVLLPFHASAVPIGPAFYCEGLGLVLRISSGTPPPRLGTLGPSRRANDRHREEGWAVSRKGEPG